MPELKPNTIPELSTVAAVVLLLLQTPLAVVFDKGVVPLTQTDFVPLIAGTTGFAFTVKFNVAALSQPVALVKFAVCEPAALNVKPFHIKGNSLSQIILFAVEVEA